MLGFCLAASVQSLGFRISLLRIWQKVQGDPHTSVHSHIATLQGLHRIDHVQKLFVYSHNFNAVSFKQSTELCMLDCRGYI